ncbi:PQQ-binding-like beta-propeller repeat protein [Rhodopirellula sp. JC740]|uniref:PQQ-binding-like beta-propeller repeat protein n=1 Tax=Rhodopirellula halodulae TaxID=2894198 RepID=A0ABS8NDE0_9BACT|nr:PQQ-binding-like beta-propeller repeat protein [Rhodopirellula sp. JC740]MCC9641424.1 PQQ-binding-like beta-propeller repeat protein [Rhodopirellula sp. JC740]
MFLFFHEPNRRKRLKRLSPLWFCLVLCFGVLACSNVHADDAVSAWPTARGDFAATGATATTLAKDLQLLWETKTAEAIESAPVSDGERVYVVDVMGGLEALAFSNGQSVWRHELDTGFSASPSLYLPSLIGEESGRIQILDVGKVADDPVLNDSWTTWLKRQRPVLVSGDVEGNVVAWDPATGDRRWEGLTDGEISASPSFFIHRSLSDEGAVVIQVRVLVTSQDGSLYCFAMDDGKLVWKYETNDQIRCGASVGDGQTFLGGCDGGLHVVDLRTGQAMREPIPLGGPTGSTPAIRDGQLYVPIMDGVLYAFAPNSDPEEEVSPKWEYLDDERNQEYRGSAAVNQELVVVASRNKTVDAIERETGKRRWRMTLRRRSDASPVIAGQDVWIASTDGRLIRLDIVTGDEKWNFEIRGAFIGEPAIVGDRLIVADDEGVVRCFGTR